MNTLRPVALALLSLTIAASAQAYEFGYRGNSGLDGRTGRNGSSGRDATIFATGQAERLMLAGQDGESGSNASDGQSAWGCSQPLNPDYDLEGAPGGSGGNAGRGGAGGNGGNLTVYYANLAALQNVYVDSTPGRGGNSGYAGRGGEGCWCQQSAWTVRKCWDEHLPNGSVQHHCQDYRHYCRNGERGRDGLMSWNRDDGNFGNLTLISSLTPPAATQESAQILFPQLASTQITLSENLWETRGGALALFAPGSRIRDSYRYFAGRKETPVSFQWTGRRSADLFHDQSLNVSVSNGQVSVSAPSSLMIETAVNPTTSGASVEIRKAIYAREATQLSAAARGQDRALEVVLDDAAHVSDLVDTRVDIKVVADSTINHKRFEGTMPASLITTTEQGLVLRVAELEGIQDKDLEEGKRLKFQMDIVRSLGGRSQTQSIELKWRIGSGPY